MSNFIVCWALKLLKNKVKLIRIRKSGVEINCRNSGAGQRKRGENKEKYTETREKQKVGAFER